LNDEHLEKIATKCSPEAFDFIQQLVKTDPKQRISA
jgi:hypothetical protein